jgi:hypothetical protein
MYSSSQTIIRIYRDHVKAFFYGNFYLSAKSIVLFPCTPSLPPIPNICTCHVGKILCVVFSSPVCSLLQRSFRWPVIWSTKLLGAGPTPRTVMLPASIWVRPASWMTSAVRPRFLALRRSSRISSSDLVWTAILAWPSFSQRARIWRSGESAAARERVL